MKNASFLLLLLCAVIVPVALGTGDEPPAPISDSNALGTPAEGGRTPGSLTTIFDAGGGGAGNMFDIKPNEHTIIREITAFDVHWSEEGEVIEVHVYYKVGTCVGYELEPSAWTLLGTGTGVSAGLYNPTHVDLAGNGVRFDPDTVYGIYVHVENYPDLTGVLARTNGGPETYSNEHLSLTTNCSNLWPAFDSAFFYRIWNGTIYYDTLDIGGLDIKVNGDDGPLTVHTSDDVTVTIHLDPGELDGIPADWWVYVERDNGATWWAWHRPGLKPKWTKAAWPRKFAGAALRTVNGYTVLGPRTMPAGVYDWYFAIDGKNSVYEGTYIDKATLTVVN